MKRILPAFIALALASPALLANEPIIYPSQGQSAEQQATDEGECHIWARDNTGIDPAVLASDTAAQQAAVAEQASQPVAEAEQRQCTLSELSLDVLKNLHPTITERVYDVLSVEASVASRTSYGGTAPSNVKAQVAEWKARLQS